MTDRELLELAAKAAGVEYDKFANYRFGLWLVIHHEPTELTRRSWNPLTDDGDALRMAVKLAINIEFFSSSNTVYVEPVGRGLSFDESLGNDPCVATRRAIVRAAAAIGKQMKEQTP